MKKRTFDTAAKQKIKRLTESALSILPFAGSIDYRYEHVGGGTFTDTKIGAVNRNPNILIVNIEWYESADEQDIRDIIHHEARHLYQWYQVNKYRSGIKTDENERIVKQWSDNLLPGNYICNTPRTEIQYFKQPVEFDAYCYSTFLRAIESCDANGNISGSYVDYPGIGDELIRQVTQNIQSFSSIDEIMKIQKILKV